MADTPIPKPVTSIGEVLCVVVPSPSCPELLRPQHLTPPPDSRAQECEPPTAIAITPEVRPFTSTGVELFIVVPLPSLPFELLPQHFTPPSMVNAQLCDVPVRTCSIPDVRPVTAEGM